jgi:hypothetical protein
MAFLTLSLIDNVQRSHLLLGIGRKRFALIGIGDIIVCR